MSLYSLFSPFSYFLPLFLFPCSFPGIASQPVVLISWEEKISRGNQKENAGYCIYKHLQYFETLCWAEPSNVHLVFNLLDTTSSETELTMLVDSPPECEEE